MSDVIHEFLLLKNAGEQARDKPKTPDTALIVNPNLSSGMTDKNWASFMEKWKNFWKRY